MEIDANRPLVSVLMTTYNSRDYVNSAIASILAQTFGDFEFVIVDDGSTDDTLQRLWKWAAKDPRVKVFPREHAGMVPQVNHGLTLCRGELLARMDSDDLALPDRFEKQVAVFKSNPDVVLVGGSYDVIDASGRLLRRIDQPTDDATLQELCLSGRTPICHPLAMMRLDAVRKLGGYNDRYAPAEDLDLWLRLGEIGKLAGVPDVILQYRLHPNSLSETKQQVQLDNMQLATQHAAERRGVTREFKQSTPWRPVGKEDQAKFTLQYGWWAWNSGQWRTAAWYGVKAIAQKPTRPDGYKLLACAFVKTSPRARPSDRAA